MDKPVKPRHPPGFIEPCILEDRRWLTPGERKSKLAKLLKGSRHHGIALNEHLEADGEKAFYHACALGFEGLPESDVTADTYAPQQDLESDQDYMHSRPAASR